MDVSVDTGIIYLGGNFTKIVYKTSLGALVDNNLGEVKSFYPSISGASISASCPDGNGGFYIGGIFTSVGGVTRNNAAHIFEDGSLDQSWNPNLDARVNAIAVSNSIVYLGGNFTTAGATGRNYAAAFNTEGVVQPWNPNLSLAV